MFKYHVDSPLVLVDVVFGYCAFFFLNTPALDNFFCKLNKNACHFQKNSPVD